MNNINYLNQSINYLNKYIVIYYSSGSVLFCRFIWQHGDVLFQKKSTEDLKICLKPE